MNFVIITLIIIILLLLFILISFLIGSNTPLVNNVHLLKGVPDIPLSSLKIKDFGTYSIEFWLFVNKFPTQSYNAISSISTYVDSTTNSNYKNLNGQTNSFTYEQIQGIGERMVSANGKNTSRIFSTKNDLITLNLFSEGILIFQNGRWDGGYLLPSLKTDNIPIQKWTYIIISVSKNSLVELYINGKLKQSGNYNDTGANKINGIQKLSGTESLQFGFEIDAYISKMYINSKAMDTNTAWKKYMNGPSVKTNYNIGVSLTQDGVNSNSINML
jgi:hypothetical protein